MKEPKIIDLDPREWRVDSASERPGDRPHEPFFGSDALEWGVFLFLKFSIVIGVYYLLHR